MDEFTVLKNAFDAGFFEGCNTPGDLERRVEDLMGYDLKPFIRDMGLDAIDCLPYFSVSYLCASGIEVYFRHLTDNLYFDFYIPLFLKLVPED